jgi:ATP-dependent helicase/nuclease subunit B
MPEVFLTRAAKMAGATGPSPRASRQRLAAVAGEAWCGKRWRAASSISPWSRDLDRAEKIVSVRRPRHRRRRSPRGRQRLSVTEIEHWLRDPYTIYAKAHSRPCRPLDAVDTPPGRATAGTVIHGAIGDFTQIHAKGLP